MIPDLLSKVILIFSVAFDNSAWSSVRPSLLIGYWGPGAHWDHSSAFLSSKRVQKSRLTTAIQDSRPWLPQSSTTPHFRLSYAMQSNTVLNQGQSGAGDSKMENIHYSIVLNCVCFYLLEVLLPASLNLIQGCFLNCSFFLF